MPDHAAGVPTGSPAMDVDLPARYPTVVPILHRGGPSRVWDEGPDSLARHATLPSAECTASPAIGRTDARRGGWRPPITAHAACRSGDQSWGGIPHDGRFCQVREASAARRFGQWRRGKRGLTVLYSAGCPFV